MLCSEQMWTNAMFSLFSAFKKSFPLQELTTPERLEIYVQVILSHVTTQHDKFFIEKIKIHLQFILFLHTDMAQVVEILSHVGQ